MLVYAQPLKSQTKVDRGVITVCIKDSIPVKIDLLYDKDSLPDKFYSYIETPVCEEGICYDLKVHFYWDLLGNFSDYAEVESDPFTKFDHEEFTAQDHLKLRKILADRTSPLSTYEPEDLVDKSMNVDLPFIDAVSGATYPALENTVVSGAVYSTYTLWNIANGALSDKIKAYTLTILDEQLLLKMASSENYNLQMHALRNISETSNSYSEVLLNLIKNGKKYVPYFAIARISHEMWLNAEIQAELIKFIGSANFEMQNEILNGLESSLIAPSNSNLLLQQYKYLKKSQYRKLVEILLKNKDSLDKSDLKKLKHIASDRDNAFAPFANGLLIDN